jgi:hypothetical protein
MRSVSQIVLACAGLAAVLIIFVHPLTVGPAATPVKGQLVLVFCATLTAIFAGLLRPLQEAGIAEPLTAPCFPEERLALICTLIC